VQSPIPILCGGTTDAAIRRVVEHCAGWTAGGMPPDAAGAFAERVRAAWKEAGRDGAPRIAALTYFSLGDTEQESRENLRDYYLPGGEDFANMIASNAARTPEAISGLVSAYEAAGIDELILDPSVADPDQVDLLAEVVFN
jgi:alkanesulfonate monooxygenase SsuD/methylene tetrahydromethanopterin reductase-like flavin-dependent oxidoreductase (luciferase family)